MVLQNKTKHKKFFKHFTFSEDMAEEEGPQKKNIIGRFQSFLHHSKRIFKISHKPTKKEYWLMTKICIVGFLILGVIAFIIHQIVVVVDPVMQT